MEKWFKRVYLLLLAIMVGTTVATLFLMGSGWGTFYVVTIETAFLSYFALNTIPAALVWLIGRREGFWTILAGTFLLSAPSLFLFFRFFTSEWTQELPEAKGGILLLTWFLSSVAGGVAGLIIVRKNQKKASEPTIA